MAVAFVATSPTVYLDSGTSQNVTIPSAASVGNLLIATAMHRSTLTPPSGWTLVESQLCTNTSLTQWTSVYKRLAQSGDPGASTTWSQASPGRFSVNISAFSGDEGLDVFSSAKSGRNNVIDNQLPYAQVSTTAAHLGVATSSTILSQTSETTMTAPSGWNLVTPGSAPNNRLAVAYKDLLADEVISGAFTIGIAGTSNNGTASVSLVVGDDTPPVLSGQVYVEDFSDKTLNQPPSGWTGRWNTANANWSVVSGGDVGGRFLRQNGIGNHRRFLSWDVIDSDITRANVEILARMRSSSTAGTFKYLFARASGGLGSENGYFCLFSNQTLGISRYVNGVSTSLASINYAWYENVWYWVRFRVNGNSLQVKAWRESEIEPESWLVSTTDSSHTGQGWVGFQSFQGFSSSDFDYVSVGTGGEPAQGLVNTGPLRLSHTAFESLSQSSSPPVRLTQTLVEVLWRAGDPGNGDDGDPGGGDPGGGDPGGGDPGGGDPGGGSAPRAMLSSDLWRPGLWSPMWSSTVDDEE